MLVFKTIHFKTTTFNHSTKYLIINPNELNWNLILDVIKNICTVFLCIMYVLMWKLEVESEH